MTQRITHFNAVYLDKLVKDAYASDDEDATGLAGRVADEVVGHGGYADGDQLSSEHERLVNACADAVPCNVKPPF